MRSGYLGTGLCLALLSIVTGAERAQADTLADAARAVVEVNKQAVVTIKLVVENRYSMEGSGSQSEESTSEITGTVIDPSGLTVVSLFTTDPTSASRNMMDMGLEEMGFKIETEIKRAGILAADGKEIPAEVVLRDKDLDLAFLRPKQPPEKPFAALELAQAGSLSQLDPIVVISRLGRVANRTHGAVLDRIEAVVDKPRTFYVPMGGALNISSLGAPVFTLEGDVVGILVLRTIRASGSGMMGMMNMMGLGGGSDNALMIILPASDVLEAAAQAPEHALPQPHEQPDEAGSTGEAAPAEVTAPEG
ncbi:MAG TPA: serine protease [Candidatus Hydrogenedentes bacterium]|nr:serine protease [Candidatus Hydrogenedentota bacterium]